MRLGLSSAAAPDLALADLLGGCQRRGLAVLELVLGDAHGVHSGADAAQIEDALRQAERADVHLAALACPAPDVDRAEEAIRLAARLGMAALLPACLASDEVGALLEVAREVKAQLLLQHGTDPEAAAELAYLVESLPAGTAALAWQVDPRTDDPALVTAVLRAAGSHLAYVRLRGGGPESAEQTGQGVGTLMARLALARYTGPLVLMPTTPRYRYIWSAWLGRAGGWGCGSKEQDSSLVTLPHAAGV
jgi:hypothetical protein